MAQLALAAATDGLQPGDSANVSVLMRKPGRCTLRLAGPGKLAAGPYTARLTKRYGAWTWKVPSSVKGGKWTAKVTCATSKRAQRTVTARIDVAFDPAGRKPLAPKGAVRFRSSSTPPSAPDAPAAGKGAGGGYPHDDALCKWTGKRAGKCADYDWGYRQANGTWALMSSRLFNYRNCTDFAAWATGLSWSSFRFPPDRGHAADWNDYAGNAGLQVARAPAVGDIAGWEAPAPDGHVAIVVAVNANGAVTTVDYNGDGKGNYTVKPNARADWYLRRASGPTTVNNPGPSATPTPTPTPPPPSGPQGGTQVVYGLGSTGAVSHLYYKPGIAGTLGQSPLLTTPGTADIAAAPTADGQQVVYTLATDGRLSEVYFRPTVAGTLGTGAARHAARGDADRGEPDDDRRAGRLRARHERADHGALLQTRGGRDAREGPAGHDARDGRHRRRAERQRPPGGLHAWCGRRAVRGLLPARRGRARSGRASSARCRASPASRRPPPRRASRSSTGSPPAGP